MKDLKSQITKIKDSINCKSTNKDLNNISNFVTKSKEKVFKTTKYHQIKKTQLSTKVTSPQGLPVLDIIKKKWVINLSSKPLTDGEQSLLQKGPTFVVSLPKVPLTEYIAVTKRICDQLGENTTGKDCTEIYQKTKEILQHYKNKMGHTHNITKEEQEAIKTLREDASHVILTADKEVALVVMDKSQYIDKCMGLLDDTKVYKPCRDTTKKLHRDVQEALQQLHRDHSTSRLYCWSKQYHNKLLPTGNSLGLITQFNNIWTFRPNLIKHIPKCSTRACRAKNLQN